MYREDWPEASVERFVYRREHHDPATQSLSEYQRKNTAELSEVMYGLRNKTHDDLIQDLRLVFLYMGVSSDQGFSEHFWLKYTS